jgi:hypothetical protein
LNGFPQQRDDRTTVTRGANAERVSGYITTLRTRLASRAVTISPADGEYAGPAHFVNVLHLKLRGVNLPLQASVLAGVRAPQPPRALQWQGPNRVSSGPGSACAWPDGSLRRCASAARRRGARSPSARSWATASR